MERAKDNSELSFAVVTRLHLFEKTVVPVFVQTIAGPRPLGFVAEPRYLLVGVENGMEKAA